MSKLNKKEHIKMLVQIYLHIYETSMPDGFDSFVVNTNLSDSEIRQQIEEIKNDLEAGNILNEEIEDIINEKIGSIQHLVQYDLEVDSL